MTTLTIEQGNNIEIVSYAVIQKLYETALNSTDVTLSGNLQCEHCFENAYNYLTGYVTEGVKRFPDLLINVTDGKYISFADPNVQKVLVNMWANGNPGITMDEINTHTIIDFLNEAGYNTENSFRSNTTITSFNELGRFTTIKRIARRQFQGASSLNSIDLTNIESIGWLAFNSCSNLTGVINLPNIITVGDGGVATQFGGTFFSCSKVTEINFGPNLTDLYLDTTFKGCTSLQKITGFVLRSDGKISAQCFNGCTSLTTISGLDLSQVKVLGKECFRDTPNFVIQNLSMPLLEGTIGDQCFLNSGVVSVSNLGTDVLYLPYGMFLNCTSLTSVTIPNQVTELKGRIFYGCSSLTSINLNNVTIIQQDVFRESGLTSVDLSGVTELGEAAFQDCTNLTDVVLPRLLKWGISNNGVFSEKSYIFQNTGLTTITIPKELQRIPGSTFRKCLLLTSVLFEQGTNLTTIGNNAFLTCSAIQQIIVPEGVTTIENAAFSEMSGLKYIEMPSTVTALEGTSMFFHSGSGNWSLVIKATTPPSCTSLGYLWGNIRIFVPDAYVDTYKNDEDWSLYSSKIYGISQLSNS